MKAILKSTIAREGGRLPPAYHYLVKPLSSDAKVWVVPNPKKCLPGQAQLYLDMVIHNVAIAASKEQVLNSSFSICDLVLNTLLSFLQVHSAIALVESADLLRMKNKYKKFRPAELDSAQRR